MSIFFNTAAGRRLIDNVNLVPEFIGKVVLNPTPIVTSEGGESGYLSHDYAGQLPPTNGRPYMVFWTLPASSADVWWWPKEQFGFPGSALVYTGISAFFSPTTPNPGVLPEAYVFSLGPVEISSLKIAVRLWDMAGRLLFDSGKLHLAVHQVAAGVALGYTETAVALPSLPGKPAFLVPSVYRDQESHSRSDPKASFMEWLGCYRRTGGDIISRMVKVNDFLVPSNQTGSYFEDQTYGNTSGLVVPVIDASLYD